MIKQILCIENDRKGTLATHYSQNHKSCRRVHQHTRQATKIISGELLVQAETIRQLTHITARLDKTERNSLYQLSGVPFINNGQH